MKGWVDGGLRRLLSVMVYILVVGVTVVLMYVAVELMVILHCTCPLTLHTILL